MTVGDLPIPEALVSLIEAGRWPRNNEEANHQHLISRVPSDRVRRIAPEEHAIFLNPPPFCKAVAHSSIVLSIFVANPTFNRRLATLITKELSSSETLVWVLTRPLRSTIARDWIAHQSSAIGGQNEVTTIAGYMWLHHSANSQRHSGYYRPEDRATRRPMREIIVWER